MELDIQALSVVAGVVVPLLVGLLTKLHAPSGIKAVLNAGLSAVAGTLTATAANSGAFSWREIVTAIGMTWITSVATHYGLYKPTAVDTKLAPNSGLGRDVIKPAPVEDVLAALVNASTDEQRLAIEAFFSVDTPKPIDPLDTGAA
jgi:hypothetical protein